MDPGHISIPPFLYRLAGVLLVFVLGAASSAVAQEEDWDHKRRDTGYLTKPGERWSESDGIRYPEAPLEENLAPLDSDLIRGNDNYFLDRASLNVGKDKVLRYTIVIEPPGGGRNVFYEGIRCATSEYKTYAYGTSSGAFSPLGTVKWRKLSSTEWNDYHRVLAKRYVCDQNGWALDVEQVQERIVQNEPFRMRLRQRPAGN
jgi:hypothetical protein